MKREKGVPDIGHWSQKEKGWWEKTVYPENVLRVPVPSFTFSQASLDSHQVLKTADGILVYMEQKVYRLPRTLFGSLQLYNYGNGWNYRCPISKFNYAIPQEQGRLL